MSKELKRVAIVVVLMFLSLFVASTIIQFVQADNLANDPRNTRAVLASYDVERGPILVDGQPIAQSVPVDSEYKFQRSYPNGLLYSQVTGFYSLNQGSTGIEQAMGDELAGISDSQFLDRLNRIFTGQSPKGASVEVTIDPVVQQAAWDALGEQRGAVVAIEPSTGKIIAMVSKPTFDPNLLASHDTDAVIDNYDALLAAPGDPLINRTISGALNPPGSTFKIITAAAAIQNAKLGADSTAQNLSRFPLPGSDSTVSNSGGGTCGGGDSVTLRTAFVLSCNVPMAEFGIQMGNSALSDMAKDFGFGQELSIPLPVTPSTIGTGMDDAQLALSSFGQYEDRATPLQIAMLSAAVANGGVLMKPNLVESVTAPDLTEISTFTPEVLSTPLSSETASILASFMTEAVDAGAASNATIDGVSVAGKTGTAENGDDDPYTLWFTGYAPTENPQIAVAVVIENGGGEGQEGSGNSIAAPIAREVLKAVLSK